MSKDQQQHWLYRPKTIKVLWGSGIAMLAILVVADLFLHPHPYFGIDGIFGFYAWFAFLSCCGFVVVAKVLGIFLKRKDSYYD